MQNRLVWSSCRELQLRRPVEGSPRVVALCRDNCIPDERVMLFPMDMSLEEDEHQSER
jgi:hypothetical protein